MKKIINEKDVIEFCKEHGITITCDFNPSERVIKEVEQIVARNEAIRNYFKFQTDQINTLGDFVVKFKSEKELVEKQNQQLELKIKSLQKELDLINSFGKNN